VTDVTTDRDQGPCGGLDGRRPAVSRTNAIRCLDCRSTGGQSMGTWLSLSGTRESGSGAAGT
jgi:hypothetical protein